MSDYEHILAQRKAHFTMVSEIRNAAPDLPFSEVEKEVAEAVKKVRTKDAANRP
jgi:hypothetical protein